ncbi:hypothetical protein Emag_000809 [Eimeria magna]
MPGQHVSETPLKLSTVSSQNNTLRDHECLSNGLAGTNIGTTTPGNCWKVRRKVSPKLSNALRLIAISALGLLVTFCLVSIFPLVRSNIAEGMHGRRLAEGGGQDDDDFSLPWTPQVVDLCIELEGELGPGGSSLETLRASPLMIESFFQELAGVDGPAPEAEMADSAGSSLQRSERPPFSTTSRKRPASEDTEDESAGSSWKLAKNDAAPPHLVSSAGKNESLPVSDADSTSNSSHHPLSSRSPEFPESHDLLDFLASTLGHYESSSVSPSGDEKLLPSSAEPPMDVSSGPRGGTVHPWVRLPQLEPGGTPRQFVPERMTLGLMSRYHADTMLRMRQLLRKQTLRTHEASQLVIYAEVLANNAFYTMTEPVTSRRPGDAAEGLGRRFIVFYLLYLTSKAVRQPWQQQPWWTDLAKAIPTGCPYAHGAHRMTAANDRSVNLALQLSAALEKYKNGSAPGDDEVVAIMRKLFCSIESPHHLKRKLWDPWRAEDQSSLPKS